MWDDVGQQPAAHLDAIDFPQISVGFDRRELENLIEVRRMPVVSVS